MNTEFFIATTKDLELINNNKLSTMVILYAMKIFLNGPNGIYMSFLGVNNLNNLFETMEQLIDAIRG